MPQHNTEISPDLLSAIRDRFAHIDLCPQQGPRVFFENAGGALTLKSVVKVSTELSAIPDNQGRDNPASQELMNIIKKAKTDTMLFLNASSGQVFVGESGTELLFRLISTAILESPAGGNVVGTSLEHPASRSAAKRWAKIAGKEYVSVPHDNETGSVDAEAYAKYVTPDTRVATIIHTSPVTGMGVDIASISATIRSISPKCLIIVDGIQHAAHGDLDIDSYNIDGYAISPYKVFSRHGYGIAWISDVLSVLPHNSLEGGPEGNWELGTRDTGAYATFSEVVHYFEWLGESFTESTDRRDKLVAAGKAIHAQEKSLTDAMIHGTGNQKGLADMPGLNIIGGLDNHRREGLVAIHHDSISAADLVAGLSEQGIRVHIRKDDHYSGNVLTPLGLPACVRVSLCHYNSQHEVAQFLAAMAEITKDA